MQPGIVQPSPLHTEMSTARHRSYLAIFNIIMRYGNIHTEYRSVALNARVFLFCHVHRELMKLKQESLHLVVMFMGFEELAITKQNQINY